MKNARAALAAVATAALLASSLAAPALADGMLLPHPPNHPIAPITELPNFSIKHHRVQVDIKDQYAKTTVDQVFHNSTQRQLEGTYLFPVPEGAQVSSFALDIDGKMTKPELLPAGSARSIYEDIVRRRIDPGLLEYAGQNLYRARVFPIPANGDKQLKLAYEEVLDKREDLHHYRYGLSTEKFSAQPLQNASLSITLETKAPLKNVYSPTHELSISRIDEHHARVSWEASQVKPDQNFDLYWTTSESPIGATLLSYKEPGEDGYFMLMASPKVQWEEQNTQSRQLTFVVDTSGSMSGEKIQQARDALVFNLKQLEPKDSFQVLSFSDTLNPLTPGYVPANAAEVKKAISYASQLEAAGGTDINGALVQAMQAEPGAGVPMLVFLTDGDPTVGETDFGTIMKNVKSANRADARLFVFGVGYDVNIPFLDRLARDNHGSSEFVRPEENIESKVSRLFSQISHPVLTSPKLSWGTIPTHDVLPSQMPDVFKGSQLIAVGRYRSGGTQPVTLSGMVNGQQRSFSFPNQSFASGPTAYRFLPRLWASRRIGQLLDEIRLQGQKQELVAEVVKLSKQYGIITEYTSFLVRDEVDVRMHADAAPMMTETRRELSRGLADSDKGSWAVSQSQNASNMQKAAAPAPSGGGSYLDAEGKVQTVTQVKYISQRAFYLKNGVWQDSLPTDNMPVIAIQRYSPLYFELAQRKELKEILALGAKVEFVRNGKLIRIEDKGQQALTPALKAQLAL